MKSTLNMLPMEMWLLIFRYTNTETFKKIMKCICYYNKDIYRKLFSIVCKDIIKKNVKMCAMVNLFKDPCYYRCRNNYMYFRNLWFNSSEKLSHDIKSRRKDYVANMEALNFKGYILNNNLITNERDKKMFVNLTFDRRDEWHKYTHMTKFYNNEIELGFIVRDVLGLNK